MKYENKCLIFNNSIYAASDSRQKIVEAKRKRNNYMLIMVASTHFLSWLPLNVINLIMNAFDTEDDPLFTNSESLLLTYAICHLGMHSLDQ